jgi:hypothetical protein
MRLPLLLLACLLLLPACTTNAIRGVVVRGETSRITVVNNDDKRLEQPGLEGAAVDMVIDPESIDPKHLQTAITDERGHFEAPISEAGAGGNKTLLITLAPGHDSIAPPRDILRDTIKTGERLMETK